MFSIKNIAGVSGILIAGLFSACASVGSYHLYDGKELPPEQVATIKLPIEIDLLAFDGVKFNHRPYAADSIEYQLTPGKHEMMIRYEKLWKDDFGNQDMVSSPYVSISLDFKPAHHYVVDFKQVRTLEDAKEFRKTFEAQVVDTASRTVEASSRLQDFAQQPKSLFSRLTNGAQNPSEAPTPLDQLMSSWKDADEGQRQAFRDFINKPN